MTYDVILVEVPGGVPFGEIFFWQSITGVNSVEKFSHDDFFQKRFKENTIVISNFPDSQVLGHGKKLSAINILLTNLSIDRCSKFFNMPVEFIDHIIAFQEGSEWFDIHSTFYRLSQNTSGPEAYLKPKSRIIKKKLQGTLKEEIKYLESLMAYTEEFRLGLSTSIAIRSIGEELLMNTLKDAPLAAKKENIAPRDSSYLSYGCDGNYFVISCQDPYGLLKKETFFFCIKKSLFRNEIYRFVDQKKEGAGLGLFKILYHSHGIACYSKPGLYTEVLAFIDLNSQLRDITKMPRSVHYFS